MYSLTALIVSHDKRIRWIHSIETYEYGTSKDLIYKNEEIKSRSIQRLINFDNKTGENDQKTINFDGKTGESAKEHNPDWIQISDPPCRIIIILGSGLQKNNALLNLISHQLNIDEIYLYIKENIQYLK